MNRILIRKLISNIYSEAQYINTMMELADRKKSRFGNCAIARGNEGNCNFVITSRLLARLSERAWRAYRKEQK